MRSRTQGALTHPCSSLLGIHTALVGAGVIMKGEEVTTSTSCLQGWPCSRFIGHKQRLCFQETQKTLIILQRHGSGSVAS